MRALDNLVNGMTQTRFPCSTKPNTPLTLQSNTIHPLSFGAAMTIRSGTVYRYPASLRERAWISLTTPI